MEGELKRVYRTDEVFVAGGEPQYTYNPRQETNIQEELKRYLKTGLGKALTIDGPTKSGKTTLVEKILPEDDGTTIWVQGQDISAIEDFWRKIVMDLGLSGDYSDTTTTTTEASSSDDFSLGVPRMVSLGGKDGTSSGLAKTRTVNTNQALADVARQGLKRVPRPIVVDDFHHLGADLQVQLARAIKSLIKTVRVTLVAVPYSAFAVVRGEPDMGWRVWRLQVPPWENAELAAIADEGFSLLNLVDADGAAAMQLAEWSYGSPFIMQQLCLDLVAVEMDIQETCAQPVVVEVPKNAREFLRRSADRTEPDVFSKLLAGPKTSGMDRKGISLKDGRETDIYGAVLSAVKARAAKPRLSDREIKTAMGEIANTTVAVNRITNALVQISKIADENRGERDPVLRFQDEQLYVVDPFLAFYLANGSWDRQL
jgi:energy-coupling factor transporter ATP-binding protein EcfA2